eukprot:g17939.t1
MAGCTSDYVILGMQAGEELATMLRLVALVISISVLFPWLDAERRGRMRIFFLHWFSGVMYVMSQFVMSVMVLNCWSSKDDSGPFIYFLKFVELTVLNLWSISSLAIAVLIAIIVQSFVKLRRVPATIGSARTSYVCVTAAVLATVLSAIFWNDILITGGYFWVANNNNVSHDRWITLSFGATQTVAGMLMALAVLFTLTGERFSSLRVCCRTSQRVKFHLILTIFGTCVYLYNGIVLLFDEFSDAKISKRLVIIGWCSRYVHVIADTGIIFGAFYALEKKEGRQERAARHVRTADVERSFRGAHPTATTTTSTTGPSFATGVSTVTTTTGAAKLGTSSTVANHKNAGSDIEAGLELANSFKTPVGGVEGSTPGGFRSPRPRRPPAGGGRGRVANGSSAARGQALG